MFRALRYRLAGVLLRAGLRLFRVSPATAVIFHGRWTANMAGEWAALAAYLTRQHGAQPSSAFLPLGCRPAFDLKNAQLRGRGPK